MRVSRPDGPRVAFNGEVDTRRGRQVRPGDVVTLEDQTLHVTTDA